MKPISSSTRSPLPHFGGACGLMAIAAASFFLLPVPYEQYSMAFFAGMALLAIVTYDAKYCLSLIGITYPLMFITKGPMYLIAFGSLYISIALTIVFVIFPINRRKIRSYGYFVPILFVVLGAIVAYVSYIADETSLVFYRTNLYEYIMYVFIFLASMNFIKSQKDSRYFMKPFILSMTILSTLLLIQYFTGIELVYTFGVSKANRLRLYLGEKSSLNMLANLYLFALPVLSYNLLIGEKVITRVRNFIPFILNLIPFILFQSRSAYLGFFVGMVLSLFVFKPIKITGKTAMMLVVVVLALLLFMVSISHLFISSRLNLGTADSDAEMRSMQLKAVSKLIINNPAGMGNAEYEKLIISYGGARVSPHNLLLSATLKIGMLGIIGYLVLIALTLYRLLKTRKVISGKEYHLTRTAIFAGILAYMIHNIWHNPGYQFEAWAFFGMAAALTAKKSIREECDGLSERGS